MPSLTPIPTTQEVVLQAIVDRLISQVTVGATPLTPSTCFVSIDPEPSVNVSAEVFLTVSPESGTFDPTFDGGADNIVMELAFAVVTIFTKIQMDRNEHAKHFLGDAKRGVFTLKRKVLKALLANHHQLSDPSGNRLLTNQMAPVSSPRPLADGRKVGDVQLVFTTDFLWDLS